MKNLEYTFFFLERDVKSSFGVAKRNDTRGREICRLSGLDPARHRTQPQHCWQDEHPGGARDGRALGFSLELWPPV